ncbi:hypothetical protein A0H81_10966 [Grifola frondosa]|uniref:Arrestin-like N-terminal domain-containing protein n=1 Tax=Grifola frondosa TaxID=5627 RepID=A0A1C7LXD4_GRIFR|nr:hypothetical protein A0H81_10966 [Grifola frondosa]
MGIILRSLVISFEGQTEIDNKTTGHATCPLYFKSRELIQGDPQLLDKRADEKGSWYFGYEFLIPGWLPGSFALDDTKKERNKGTTSYALHAKAKFMDVKDPVRRSHTARATKRDFSLNYLRTPSSNWLEYKFGMYDFNVLWTTEVRYPEFIGIDWKTMPVIVRLRTSLALPDEKCQKLRVQSLSLIVKQEEKLSNTVLSSYPARRHLSSDQTSLVVRLLGNKTREEDIFLANKHWDNLPNGGYILNNAFVQANGGTYEAAVEIPLSPGEVRESYRSPLLSVAHTMLVRICLEYPSGSRNPMDYVNLHVPLSFVRFSASNPVREVSVQPSRVQHDPPFAADVCACCGSLLPSSEEPPRYSQLF